MLERRRAILGYSSGFRPPNLPSFACRANGDISAEVLSMAVTRGNGTHVRSGTSHAMMMMMMMVGADGGGGCWWQAGGRVRKWFLRGCGVLVDKTLHNCQQTFDDNECLLRTSLPQLHTNTDDTSTVRLKSYSCTENQISTEVVAKFDIAILIWLTLTLTIAVTLRPLSHWKLISKFMLISSFGKKISNVNWILKFYFAI